MSLSPKDIAQSELFKKDHFKKINIYQNQVFIQNLECYDFFF